MSIKRYDMRGNTWPADDGNVVSYLDHAAVVAELEARCAAMAAENAVKQEFIKTCFRSAADGASMDDADIQELGERLGLFGRETYQPVLHGYICGHEAGEDTVYVMKKTPATAAFLAEVRAQGADAVAAYHAEREEAISEIAPFASRDHKNARVHAMDIAEQLRQEAK